MKIMEALRMHEDRGKLKTIGKMKKNYVELKRFEMEDNAWISKVIIGDIREIIDELSSNVSDCIITLPPYWMQRDHDNPKQIVRIVRRGEYPGIRSLLGFTEHLLCNERDGKGGK